MEAAIKIASVPMPPAIRARVFGAGTSGLVLLLA